MIESKAQKTLRKLIDSYVIAAFTLYKQKIGERSSTAILVFIDSDYTG